MTNWRASQSVTAEDVEAFARRIPADDENINIIVQDVRTVQISAVARLVGLLARLRREGRDIRLHLDTGDPSTGLRNDSRFWSFFSDELVGIALSTFCSSILKKDGEDILRLIQSRQSKLESDDPFRLSRGDRTTFPTRDERPKIGPAPILHSLLSGDRHVFAGGLLSTFTRSLNLPGLEASATSQINRFVWEVLKNTQDHGRLGGGSPTAGIRFVEIRRFNTAVGDTRALVGANDTELSGFINRTRKSRPATPLVEITIADSGPGIAATMAKSYDVYNADLSVESNLIEEAFTRQGTSRRTTDPDAGGGLTMALEACNALGGYISVRTGRSIFARSFDSANNGPLVLESSDRILPHIDGTAISIVIPWGSPLPPPLFELS